MLLSRVRAGQLGFEKACVFPGGKGDLRLAHYSLGMSVCGRTLCFPGSGPGGGAKRQGLSRRAALGSHTRPSLWDLSAELLSPVGSTEQLPQGRVGSVRRVLVEKIHRPGATVTKGDLPPSSETPLKIHASQTGIDIHAACLYMVYRLRMAYKL